MDITILITTYNRVDRLKTAVRSALSQSVPVKVFIVDDHSDDGTEKYCRDLAEREERVRYFRQPGNSGHRDAINRGLDLIEEPWVKFLDDDDILSPLCAEIFLKGIERYRDAMVLSCRAAKVGEAGQLLGETPRRGQIKIFTRDPEEVFEDMYLDKAPLGTTSQLAVNREAFILSGGWQYHKDQSFDDIYSMVKAVYGKQIVYIDSCLVRYTVWEGNQSRAGSAKKKIEANLEVKKRIWEKLTPDQRRDLPGLDIMKKYLSLYWGLVSIKDGRLKEGFHCLKTAALSPRAWNVLRGVYIFRNRGITPSLDEKTKRKNG